MYHPLLPSPNQRFGDFLLFSGNPWPTPCYTVGAENRTIVARIWQCGEALTTKRQNENLGELEVFYILIVVVVTWLNVIVKTHRIIHWKGWILHYTNYISIKPCFRRKEYRTIIYKTPNLDSSKITCHENKSRISELDLKRLKKQKYQMKCMKLEWILV